MAVKINTNYTTQNPNNTGDRKRAGVKSDYRWIVVHYVGACNWKTGFESSAKNNCIYYRDSNPGASANYYVDSTDEVYMSVPWYGTRYAWHCGTGSNKTAKYLITDPDGTVCNNMTSLGVEICTCKQNIASRGSTDPDWYFDPRTYEHAVEFIQYLMKEFNIDIDHVIRHYDVNTIHKPCPSQFVGHALKSYYYKTGERNWEEFKKRLVGGEKPVAKSISVTPKASNYTIGQKLTASDFNVKVLMSDGSSLLNPPGWTATPLLLSSAVNKIKVAYETVSDIITVAATDPNKEKKEIKPYLIVSPDNTLNLRKLPNNDGEIITIMRSGAFFLTSLVREDGWVYGRYIANNTVYEGWCYSKYLKAANSEIRVVQSPNGTLPIRDRVGTSGNVLATMGNGFHFGVLRKVNQTYGIVWCGDVLGYCDVTDKYSKK